MTTAADKRRQARFRKFVDESVGPREVGGRYLVNGTPVTVLAVNRDTGDWMSWSVTEATDAELADGRSRTHCTAWDYDRPEEFRVIAEPGAPIQQNPYTGNLDADELLSREPGNTYSSAATMYRQWALHYARLAAVDTGEPGARNTDRAQYYAAAADTLGAAADREARGRPLVIPARADGRVPAQDRGRGRTDVQSTLGSAAPAVVRP